MWFWQNFRRNDLQIDFCVDVWATATRVQLSQARSLNDSTENICRETSDGGWIWHLGTWRAMNVFQVLQRDEQRIEPCNLQTTTKFMFSSKWFSLTLVIIQTNFCVGLAAVALGWSLPPGINTLILWFSQYLHKIVVVGMMRPKWRFASVCTYLHYPPFNFTKVVMWKQPQKYGLCCVTNKNPPPVWRGISVPV